MKIKALIFAIAGIILLGLAGCGGGGGGGTPTTVVSGTASKGLVRNAKVQAFSITAPNTFNLLKEGVTDVNGNYSLDLGSYTGPVKVEVSGGEFKDETTGAFTPMLFTIRAVIGNTALGSNNMMVTGLTEIAVKKIEGSANQFDAASIDQANRTVASFFGVSDIIGTAPADVTVGGGGDTSYGLALASLMQYAKRPGGVTKAFDDFSKLLNGKLDPSSQTNNQILADQVIADYLTDKNTFLANTNQNKSGESGVTSATTAEVKLKTDGTLPAGTKINALELTLSMPAGVTIPAGQDGSVDVSSPTAPVKVSGVVAQALVGTQATLLAGGTRFATGSATAPNKLKLVFIFSTATGFDVGEFATVTCNIAPGTVVTPGHFIVSGIKVVTVGTDTSSIGAPLAGVSASATVILK
jgi:hypothetical protein